MKNIIILGGGNIGFTSAHLLHHSKKFKVTVVDLKENQFTSELQQEGIAVLFGNLQDRDFLRSLFKNTQYVLSACPFSLNKVIAEVASEMNVHYFDFTEDVSTTNHIKKIAETSRTAFMPQCGLAPGYISIAAHHLSKYFDTLDTVKLRVGALTQNPNNRLKYNLSWSTEGLINEYCNPCTSISNGQFTEALPLEGVEHLTLDGVEYEAFNTSGGVGGLADLLKGKVKNLDYKTIRYVGHRDLMYFLLYDLKFVENQKELVSIFNKYIPETREDLVLLYVSASGLINNKFVQKTISKKITNQIHSNKHFTAIQLTTAGSACAVIDMHAQGLLPSKGFITQEEVDFEKLSASSFAVFYKTI